jgi:hypothetical protein
MVALPVLVSGLEAEMIRLGYKDLTMAWYHGAWRRLQRYFTFRGVGSSRWTWPWSGSMRPAAASSPRSRPGR